MTLELPPTYCGGVLAGRLSTTAPVVGGDVTHIVLALNGQVLQISLEINKAVKENPSNRIKSMAIKSVSPLNK